MEPVSFGGISCSDFVDTPYEAFPFQEDELLWWGEGERAEGGEGELGEVCKMRKDWF